MRRPFTTRLALRKIRKEHPEARDDINTIMQDDDMLGMLEEEVQGVAGAHVKGAMDWFTYLIENWEAVLKVISVIVLLLGKGGES